MRYVICAPPYTEEIGGVIVLHELCHLLNKIGEEAYVWPIDDDLEAFVRYEQQMTPLADRTMIDDAVVVYPEVVAGNPLAARRVVRWFLNKPGRITGTVDYGDDELYFFFAKGFDDPDINTDPDNLLRVHKIFTEIFTNRGAPDRKGSCYIMRKGKGRKIIHDLTDSIEIQPRWPLREIADVFNKTRFCICYDIHTMLAYYAAMCGCVSVIVPHPDLPREVWRKEHGGLVGVAYGFGDIAYAADTVPLIKEELLAEERASTESVQRFVAKAEAFFGKRAR